MRILFIFEAVGVRALIEKEQNTQHKLSKINDLTLISSPFTFTSTLLCHNNLLKAIKDYLTIRDSFCLKMNIVKTNT